MSVGKKEILFSVVFLLFMAGCFVGQGLWLALVPFCLMLMARNHTPGEETLSYTDIFVIFVCLAEILSCIFSVYTPNSIRALETVLLVSFFWFYLRNTPAKKNQYSAFVSGVSYLSLVLSAITIVTFINYKLDFSVYSGANLTDFKREFRPFGMPVNDWVAFLLCVLPYPFVAAIHSGAGWKRILHLSSAALLITSVMLSLSRGAYIALFVFLAASVVLCVIFRGDRTKQYLISIGIAFLVGFTLLLPARKEVVTTCTMSQTTSQKLSTAGRIQLIGDAAALWKEYPIAGVGQGNFNIVYDGTITERKSSRTRATNVYALILVERGLVGLLAYCGLILSALLTGFRNAKHHPDIILFEACLTALCFRGLFFSSLFDYKLVFVLTMLMMYNLIQDSDNEVVTEQ